MKQALLTLSLLALSAPAFARDSTHLVCTGFMTSQPGPDNYGLAIHLDEMRHGDGRIEVLSTIWQGNLFQGSRETDGMELGHNGQITLASRERADEVFYAGKYDLIKNPRTDTYQLKLVGRMSLDPAPISPESQKIATTLNCVNLSN